MGKFNVLSCNINYQTKFLTIHSKWKMFQIAQMTEEKWLYIQMIYCNVVI